MVMKCTSCKTEILNDSQMTKFPCPACAKEDIVRCGDCRSKSVKYKCSKCGHIGP